MTSHPKPHPITVLGVIAFAAGLTAWAWLGDWRWAVTGTALLLALAATGAVLDRKDRP